MYVTDKIMRKIKITSIHWDVITPGTYFLAGNRCYFMLLEQYHVILKQPLGGTVCIFILCEKSKIDVGQTFQGHMTKDWPSQESDNTFQTQIQLIIFTMVLNIAT